MDNRDDDSSNSFNENMVWNTEEDEEDKDEGWSDFVDVENGAAEDLIDVDEYSKEQAWRHHSRKRQHDKTLLHMETSQIEQAMALSLAESATETEKKANDESMCREERLQAEIALAWWGGQGAVDGEWRLPASYRYKQNTSVACDNIDICCSLDAALANSTTTTVQAPLWCMAKHLPSLDPYGGIYAGHAFVWRACGVLHDLSTSSSSPSAPSGAFLTKVALSQISPHAKEWWIRFQRAVGPLKTLLYAEWLQQLAKTTAFLASGSEKIDRWPASVGLTKLECIAARGDIAPLVTMQACFANSQKLYTAIHPHMRILRSKEGIAVKPDGIPFDGLCFDAVTESPMAIAVAANHVGFVSYALQHHGLFFSCTPYSDERFKIAASQSSQAALGSALGSAVPCVAQSILNGVGRRGHLTMFELLASAYVQVYGDRGKEIVKCARFANVMVLNLALGQLARTFAFVTHRRQYFPACLRRIVLSMLFPVTVYKLL